MKSKGKQTSSIERISNDSNSNFFLHKQKHNTEIRDENDLQNIMGDLMNNDCAPDKRTKDPDEKQGPNEQNKHQEIDDFVFDQENYEDVKS